MRLSTLFLLASLAAFNCAPKSEHDHSSTDAPSENPNQVLYNQVMDIHDEVMPKMEGLYNMKKELQDQLSKGEGLTEEVKQKLEARVVVIDSVSKMMMDWMHEFNPLPDSANQEDAREYLETEMEKIKKVREAMLETLQSNGN